MSDEKKELTLKTLSAQLDEVKANIAANFEAIKLLQEQALQSNLRLTSLEDPSKDEALRSRINTELKDLQEQSRQAVADIREAFESARRGKTQTATLEVTETEGINFKIVTALLRQLGHVEPSAELRDLLRS